MNRNWFGWLIWIRQVLFCACCKYFAHSESADSGRFCNWTLWLRCHSLGSYAPINRKRGIKSCSFTFSGCYCKGNVRKCNVMLSSAIPLKLITCFQSCVSISVGKKCISLLGSLACNQFLTFLEMCFFYIYIRAIFRLHDKAILLNLTVFFLIVA